MNSNAKHRHQPWNKGKLVGQKAPLRVRDIWAIRVRLQLAEKTRDLALFNLAIDSKLRACDLTKLRVRDIAHGEHVSSRGKCPVKSSGFFHVFVYDGLPTGRSSNMPIGKVHMPLLPFQFQTSQF